MVRVRSRARVMEQTLEKVKLWMAHKKGQKEQQKQK